MAPEQRLARKLLDGGNFGEQGLQRLRGRRLQTRQHPAWGALEHLDEPGLLDQFGDDLDGAGTGTDYGDSFAREVVVVIPARAVNLVSLIAVQAAHVGEADVRQRAGGQDDRAGTKSFAILGLGRPHTAALVEGQVADLMVEPDVATDVELGRHVFEVTTDLRRG